MQKQLSKSRWRRCRRQRLPEVFSVTVPASTGSNPSDPRASLQLPMVAGTLAISAAVLLAAAGIGTRLGLWHFRTGFDLLRYGAYCGSAAFLVAAAATLASFRSRCHLGLLLALLAAVSGAVFTAVPLKWKFAAQRLPRIHDITTDITNPPSFVALLPLRKDAPNPATYGGTEVAVLQRQGYPDIKTVVLELPLADAYEKAYSAARTMGWKIVAAVPGEGRIEAIDTTLWFGFKDDIVIRIAPAGNRSLLDIRSVSRVGVSDVGTNAWRIRAYLKRLTG
jgi:hypothetical protein